MIKWCAYCLHFIKQYPPFDDFQISHGVCPACVPKVLSLTAEDKHKLQELRAFLQRVRTMALAGEAIDTERLWQDCARLGLYPMDLMMGLLQPLLEEIGQLWVEGALTVAAEHQFSAAVQKLLDQVRRNAATLPHAPRLRLMLVNAEGNQHTLGLEMANLILAAYDLPAFIQVQGLPVEDLLELVRTHRPCALGFSIALPEHLGYVLEVASRLRELPEPPTHLLLGGAALATGVEVPPAYGFQLCHHIDEIPGLLGLPAPCA